MGTVRWAFLRGHGDLPGAWFSLGDRSRRNIRAECDFDTVRFRNCAILKLCDFETEDLGTNFPAARGGRAGRRGTPATTEHDVQGDDPQPAH